MSDTIVEKIVREMTNLHQDLKALRYIPGNDFETTIDILGDLIDWIEKIRNEEPTLTNFIPWEGGEQPVPNLTHVHVKFRKSEWDSVENLYAGDLDWVHDGTDTDIIAYHVVYEQPFFQLWTGGANPAGDEHVEYAYRADPNVILTTTANFLDWSHDPEDSDVDIVLYRIINKIKP